MLHLGNGASASAIAGGKPVDTSMGLTPMEGLVMGTRSGDVDPGIITYLSRTAEMSVEDIETMLNKRSGVLGLGGEIDFRVLHQRIESGDAAAQLAYDVYIHRLRKYIGAYMALLGNTDVITFTAGVGENDAAVRRDALSGLTASASSSTNSSTTARDRGARRISADNSRTTVLVIPTDEELAIARACVAALSRTDCGPLSGRLPSGSQIARRRRSCRPACRTQLTSLPAADHVDVVQRRETGGAEEVDEPKVELEARQTSATRRLDITGQCAAVRRVDVTLDGDRAAVDGGRWLAEKTARPLSSRRLSALGSMRNTRLVPISVMVTSLSRTWRRCGWLLTQPEEQITTKSDGRRYPNSEG